MVHPSVSDRRLSNDTQVIATQKVHCVAAGTEWLGPKIDLARNLLKNGLVPLEIHTQSSHAATLPGAVWLGAGHLVVDAVCVAAVLRASPPSDSLISSALAFVLAYDVLAFAGQVPLGWLSDRLRWRRGAALAGLVLTAAALFAGSSSGTVVVLLAGAGNALFHVGAGAMVLAGSKGCAAPAGVFVAPGALGLGLGLILGRKFLGVPLWPWYFALAAASIAVLLVSQPSEPGEEEKSAQPVLARGEVVAILALLATSVAIRSLVGTVGCDACPRGMFLLATVPLASCAGKLSGGFLADRFGWINLSVVALLASAPLLAFSGGDVRTALPGVLIFQMTMPVTLAATLRVLPARPGLTFGMLSLAIVVGTLPAYLPGGWRPQGLALFFLVLCSAAALYGSLRRLLRHTADQVSPSKTSRTPVQPPTLAKGNP